MPWMKLLVVVALAVLGLVGTTTASQPVGDIRVSVVDRSSTQGLSGATVRLVRDKVALRNGVTGYDGTVGFAGVAVGRLEVEGERIGYLRKPEKRPAEIATTVALVTIHLLAAQQESEYFRKAGASIENEAKQLPEANRKSFYELEWGRIKQLESTFQIPLILELKEGQRFLASDPDFKKLTTISKIGE